VIARVLLVLCLCACGGEVKAPVPIGFTGTCDLDVPRDTSGYAYSFRTADQMKSHVRLRIVKDMLVAVHVEVPDNRHSAFEELPDHPLVVGDAAPNVTVDRGGDIDVPMQLHSRDAHGEAQDAWDVVVRVRFRDEKAEVVAGLMVVSGPCIISTNP
jgi:hypothetical protein